MTCAEMLRRVKSISLENEAGHIIDQNLEELKALNIKQLMQGKNNKGELLSPKHSENPFFKKPGAGLRYAAWKAKLYPETPFDIPNLKIIGTTRESLSFERRGNVITAGATVPWAASIESTFNGTPFGLNNDSKEVVWNDIIKSPLLHTLADKIGCSVSG